jgi:hypothetical protein
MDKTLQEIIYRAKLLWQVEITEEEAEKILEKHPSVLKSYKIQKELWKIKQ